MIQTQFSGISNTSSARDISETCVSDLVNADVTNALGLQARLGKKALLTSAAINAAYTTKDGICYVVSGGYLCRVDESGALARLAPSTADKFCDSDGHLFTNDGLMVFADRVQNLVVPPPRTPSVVLTGGSRPAGKYTIVCTYRNKDGRESGTSYPITIELSAPGDFLVQPQGDASTQEIYVTEPNGSVLFNQRSGVQIPPSLINSATFDSYAATSIAFYDSRLFYAVQLEDYAAVFYSDPFQYHIFGTDSSYFVVPGRIEAMMGGPDGIAIGTQDRIYTYTRDGISEVAGYGVVPGQPMVKSTSGRVYAYTWIGVCALFPLEELTVNQVSLSPGQQCQMMYVIEGGTSRLIATHDNFGPAVNKFS